MSFSDEEALEEFLVSLGYKKVQDEEVKSNESMAWVFEKKRYRDVSIVRISTKMKDK